MRQAKEGIRGVAMTTILASKARVNKEGKRTEEKKKIANIREEIRELGTLR